MSEDVTPIRRIETCTQRQDAAIAWLIEAVEEVRSLAASNAEDLYQLRERVTQLESIHSSVHPKSHSAPLEPALQTDFLFDGDGATVQRNKSRDGKTGRDFVSVETAEVCACNDPWAYDDEVTP